MKINKLIFFVMAFVMTGCILIGDEPRVKMSEIMKIKEEVGKTVLDKFFVIDKKNRMLKKDELTQEMISSLKSLNQFTLQSITVENINIKTFIDEIGHRFNATTTDAIVPSIIDNNNKEIDFPRVSLESKNISFLELYSTIASNCGYRLWLNQDGKLFLTPKEDEFHLSLPEKYHSGGYIICEKERNQKGGMTISFKAIVQGIVVGKNVPPIGYEGIQKYYLPNLKEQIDLRVPLFLAVEELPYVELQLMIQNVQSKKSIVFSASSPSCTILLHRYKNFFGQQNPIENEFIFTIETTQYGNGLASFELKSIRPMIK